VYAQHIDIDIEGRIYQFILYDESSIYSL